MCICVLEQYVYLAGSEGSGHLSPCRPDIQSFGHWWSRGCPCRRVQEVRRQVEEHLYIYVCDIYDASIYDKVT